MPNPVEWAGDAASWLAEVAGDIGSWLADVARWSWRGLSGLPWLAILGGAASVIALVGFAYWVAELRRRPEVRFAWLISRNGAVDDLFLWPPDDRPTVPPGSEVVVEVSVANVGDAATRAAQTNFVVPASVTCKTEDPREEPRVAIRVGLAPAAFVPAAFELAPGNWRLQRFRLQLPKGDGGVRLWLELSDSGLNAGGWRWLPSRRVGELPVTAYDDDWPPPKPSWRRQWGWVRPIPRGHVWCARGVRADARDLMIGTVPTSDDD